MLAGLLAAAACVASADSAATFAIQDGRPVDPYLFGWDLEEWGLILNLSFSDTAGIALTEALHAGALRYPGGTGSNIWDMRTGRYLPTPKGSTGGYDKWEKWEAPINSMPEGTFSAASYVAGLGGRAKRVVWDLNVYTLNASEACDRIKYISTLPGQQEDGVLLELGNELYISGQGLPYFPTSTVYAEAMKPVVACARRFMPRAKVGACGAPGEWNQGLKPYLHMFDGVSHHNYSPRTETVDHVPPEDRVSYVAGYSRAAAMQDVQQQREDLGADVPMWLTEFGYGLDKPGDCLLPSLLFGGVHGAFHAGRVLAAVNMPGAFGAMTFETFVFRDPPEATYPHDWCGMPAGTATQHQPNRPDLARVTGTGQLVAHLFAVALGSTTMHPVAIGGSPAMPTPIFNTSQPCLQAAAFSNSTAVDAGARVTKAVALLNICAQDIAVGPVGAEGGTATVYNLTDPGGKAPLPADPSRFPWPGPLRARVVAVRTASYTAPALSFSLLELHGDAE